MIDTYSHTSSAHAASQRTQSIRVLDLVCGACGGAASVVFRRLGAATRLPARPGTGLLIRVWRFAQLQLRLLQLLVSVEFRALLLRRSSLS